MEKENIEDGLVGWKFKKEYAVREITNFLNKMFKEDYKKISILEKIKENLDNGKDNNNKM